MLRQKYYFKTLLLAFSVFAFASCGLFRRKNRCNTCPKWTKVEPAVQDSNKTYASYIIVNNSENQ